MSVESGFAAVNSTRLYYELAGSGTPVALIHGFTLDTRMWDDQFQPLAEHYRVLRYDARGFGRSDLPTDEPFSPHDDLRALLEHGEVSTRGHRGFMRAVVARCQPGVIPGRGPSRRAPRAGWGRRCTPRRRGARRATGGP